jgi:hypothetical protein
MPAHPLAYFEELDERETMIEIELPHLHTLTDGLSKKACKKPSRRPMVVW